MKSTIEAREVGSKKKCGQTVDAWERELVDTSKVLQICPKGTAPMDPPAS